VVLEVFYLVHEMLSNTGRQHHLAVRIVPQFILPLEDWIQQVLDASELPSSDEVHENLTGPLLEQVLVDAGPTIHELSAGRLGIDRVPQSVRQQAKRMGVTRARVYQLLEDCSRIMSVRWPEGQQLLAQLDAKFHADSTAQHDPRLFEATYELFYPGKYNLSDEEAALESVAEPG
jgi:hypothetical protein